MSAVAARRAEIVLLVDDDPWFRRSMAIALKLEGYQVVEAGTTAEALEAIGKHSIDVALVDLLLGTERGEVVLREIAQARPTARLVSMSACDGLRSRVAEMEQVLHLEKPFLATELVELLEGPRRMAR